MRAPAPLLAAVAALLSLGADWPQWLGPNRDAVWSETGILTTMPKDGPPVLWRKPVGDGYAGPAVAGGRVYLMDRLPPKEGAPAPAKGVIPGRERVLCLDAATGNQVWAHEYDCPYSRVSYPEGPRTTPVVSGGKVYTLGTMGDMLCLDAATGNQVWATNFVRDCGAKPPLWGYSAHLLLEAGKLITLVGGADGKEGAVRAFDAATGKEVWKALSEREVCYAPPVVAEAAGVRQVITFTATTVAGLNPETGAVYWKLRYPDVPEGKEVKRPGQPALTIATPRVAGGVVYVSSYFDGCLAVKLSQDKPSASVLWGANVTVKGADKLPSLMTTLFVKAGHLYGLNADGAVECRKADTGEAVWSDTKLFQGKEIPFASAFWVENGGNIWALTDLGDLVLCRLSPKGYEELGRAHVIEPTLSTRGRKAVWAHPAFAGKCVFARNGKEVVCLNLAAG